MRYPEFHIPFPLAINPYADRAEQHGREFVRRFDLVLTDDAKRHFDESLLGILVSSACPRADRVTLELLADWMACNLVLDDLFDETEIGMDPIRLRKLCDQVVAWLPATGPVANHDDSPFARAYADLWKRSCVHMGPTWRQRFNHHFAEFFNRCVWEAENRKNQRIPPVDEYIKMRACGFMPYVDLLELAAHWEIPQDIYSAEIFGELNLALSESILWMNDLFSSEKEYRLGDVHNLVVVIRHADGIDLQTAADAVSEMIQGRINDFVTLSQRFSEEYIPTWHDSLVRAALTRHITNMRSWMRGQLHWRYQTKRNEYRNLRVVDGQASRSY